jgi:hypothetical protein
MKLLIISLISFGAFLGYAEEKTTYSELMVWVKAVKPFKGHGYRKNEEVKPLKSTCPIPQGPSPCGVEVENYREAGAHLIKQHDAQIGISNKTDSGFWEIQFRYPVPY